MKDSFYMLHVEGGGSPTVKHYKGLNEAMLEAERLCKQTGREVFLLTANSSCRPYTQITHVEWRGNLIGCHAGD